MAPSVTINPLKNAPFGAVVDIQGCTDPSLLPEEDFNLLADALHKNLVLVFKNQKGLSPESQLKLTSRFDPSAPVNQYGHGKEFRDQKSVLRKDGISVPDVPQVQILGQGQIKNHCGHRSAQLTHPTHLTFHKDVLSKEDLLNGYTRFYRWHIDSALYGLSAPVCTTLLALNVPSATTKRQKIRYEDTLEELEVAQAATAFISGANAFDILSDEDKKLALETTVVYPPHPFIFISDAKATWDGLSMHSEERETALCDMPPFEKSKIKRLPLVWTNPVTGKHHLQAAGCAVHKLERPNGQVLELEDARIELRRLMRPAIAPGNVYAHAWEEGDLVVFYNRGVWHSVTGQFSEGESRLMHQCNLASASDPICVKS